MFMTPTQTNLNHSSLYSEDTEESAALLSKQVITIHAAACFHWASNSASYLKQLSDTSRESQDFKEWGANEKVLGMYWDPINDIYKFARLLET